MKRYWRVLLCTVICVCFFISVSAVFSSCKAKDDQPGEKDMAESIENTAQPAPVNNAEPMQPDASSPEAAVLNFLQWYKAEYDAISAIRLLDTGGEYTRVNFEGTEAYLARLKESGYISPKYITRWREYFKECDDHFNEVKLGDGYYAGFEFDFVLWTQTIHETLNAIDTPKLLSSETQDGTSVVKISVLMNLGFRLSLYDGQWKIDEIFNLGI